MERHIPNVDESLINATELIVRHNIKIPSKMFNKCELSSVSENSTYIIGVIITGKQREFINYLIFNEIEYSEKCIYEYDDEYLFAYDFDDIFKYQHEKLFMLYNIKLEKFLKVNNDLYALFPDFRYTPICSEFYCDFNIRKKSMRISNHEGYNNFEDIYKLVIYLKQNKIQIPNILKHFYIRYYNYYNYE